MAAIASGLVGEQAWIAILQPIIVRFDEAQQSPVDEAHLTPGFDRGAERFMQSLRDQRRCLRVWSRRGSLARTFHQKKAWVWGAPEFRHDRHWMQTL